MVSSRFSLVLKLHHYFACIVMGGQLLAATSCWAAPDRLALVVGNSEYKFAPLANPKHDAVGMAQLLEKAGFTVDRQLDTDLAQLQAAVSRFGQAIKDPQVKFGLFYYAGHGLQQDWRNYLVPVSAQIRNAADVPKQTVDVSQLLRYMEQAQGRNFLIILDACRDDPFAGTFRPTAKGLSQFDAPVGSLLAYATAPGNVAQDGHGKNGLYTSYLLREFAVQGVRVEDAFKRVRLSVRMASNGQQIPWESTSLEDDLYLFPSHDRALSESEKDQLLEREMSSWLRVKNSTDPETLAAFIREFPSGSASELAQSRLNRLFAAMMVREQQRLGTLAASAATAVQELTAREDAARKRAAEAEAMRLAAARAEDERRFLAQQRAAQEEVERQRLASEAAQRVEIARLDAERVRAAEQEAQRLEQIRSDAERRRAQQLLAAQAEAARQSEQIARLAQEQAVRAQALNAQREAEERARANKVEQDRLALAENTLRLQREAELVASQKASLLASTAKMLPAITVLPPTPYSKGYAEHQRSYQVGDSYQHQVIDLQTRISKPLTMKVTQIDLNAERVVYNDGEFVSDLMGNTTTNQRGVFSTPRQFYPADLYVGKKWTTRFKQSRPNNVSYTFEYKLKVVARETVTVPAGTYETFKIEARGFNLELGAYLERNIWVSPGINADIAHEIKVRLRNNFLEQNDRQELISIAKASR